jgi:hypothetical protein
MRHVAWFNTLYRVLPVASLAPLIAVAGDATHHTLLWAPSPDTPAVIYAIPQSQAFAIAREAIRSTAARCGVAADEARIVEMTGAGGAGPSIRGYVVSYRGENSRFFLLRQLFVISTAGIAGSSQQIYGFRFEITNFIPGSGAGPGAAWGAACEKALASTLQTALDATDTATTVTSLRVRPHWEGRAAP